MIAVLLDRFVAKLLASPANVRKGKLAVHAQLIRRHVHLPPPRRRAHEPPCAYPRRIVHPTVIVLAQAPDGSLYAPRRV